MRDSELLGSFVGKRDHAAFGQVVGRYVDLVYSAAVRQVRDRELAEDVTQTVFVLLMRKAESLAGEDVVLSGWLLKSTRFVALNAIKYQARRRRHEREAAAMAEQSKGSRDGDSVWQQIAPMLDAALMRLRRDDRAAVVLRYLQGKTNEEVGRALGLSEDAARKRITRAVEELRGYFAGKGVTVAPAALEASLVAWAVGKAPATLAGSVASAAQGGAQSALTRFVVKSRMTKVAQVAVAGVVLAGVWIGVWWFGRGTASPGLMPMVAGQVAAGVPAAPKPAEATKQAYFEFQAVDAETGKPVPDVALDIRIDNSTSSAKTDAEGKHRVYLPAQLQYGVQIAARKGNLVPMSVTWQNGQLRGGMIPNYVLKMEKGTAIGGVVQDEQGKGIAGASVFLVVPGSESGSDKPRAMIHDYEVKTDAEGRWRCDIMPSQLDGVWIRLAHPQFASDTMYGASGNPPVAKLRDGSAVMVLKRGLTVSGRVVDEMARLLRGRRWCRGRIAGGPSTPRRRRMRRVSSGFLMRWRGRWC